MCVCGVYLLISHQWGKLQHLFLFLLADDTQLVCFGADTPQILAAEFFGSTLGGYAMASVISTWATPHLKPPPPQKKPPDYCIPKQSLWKCAHTGWLEELPRSAHGLRATLKKHKRKLQKKESRMLRKSHAQEVRHNIRCGLKFVHFRQCTLHNIKIPIKISTASTYIYAWITKTSATCNHNRKERKNPKTKQIQHTHKTQTRACLVPLNNSPACH